VGELRTFFESNPLSSLPNLTCYCEKLQEAVVVEYQGLDNEVAKRNAFTKVVMGPLMVALDQHKGDVGTCQMVLVTLAEFITPASRQVLLANNSQSTVVEVGTRYPEIVQFAINVLAALGLQEQAIDLRCKCFCSLILYAI